MCPSYRHDRHEDLFRLYQLFRQVPRLLLALQPVLTGPSFAVSQAAALQRQLSRIQAPITGPTNVAAAAAATAVVLACLKPQSAGVTRAGLACRRVDGGAELVRGVMGGHLRETGRQLVSGPRAHQGPRSTLWSACLPRRTSTTGGALLQTDSPLLKQVGDTHRQAKARYAEQL